MSIGTAPQKEDTFLMDKFYVEGNNGGDYLQLEHIRDNVVMLQIGHCCVVTVNHEVPIELITSALTNLFLEHDNKATQWQNWKPGWARDFVNKLRSQIKPVKSDLVNLANAFHQTSRMIIIGSSDKRD